MSHGELQLQDATHCFFGNMDHWKEKYICFDDHLRGFYETHEGPKWRFPKYLDFVLQL
jgi:hypothetical protein